MRITNKINSALPHVNLPLPEDDPQRRNPDITLAKETLDWLPTVSLDDGLEETLLPYTQQFVNKLSEDGHFIILTTARWESQRPQTVEMLEEFNFKYHQLIMGIGSGERIVVNDIKPVGLEIDDNI